MLELSAEMNWEKMGTFLSISSRAAALWSTAGRRQSRHRRTVAAVLFAVSFNAAVTSCAGKKEERVQKPNVIWIVEDACRAQNLSCYGYDRPTSPNLDKLAARGVLFEQNFAQGTHTTLSVPSYMTGRYLATPCVGVYGRTYDYRDVVLPAEAENLLPEIFSQNSYETAMIGHGGPYFSPQNRLPKAFDYHVGVKPGKPPLASFEELNLEIFSYLARPRDKPFFLYVHAVDTHFPHYLEPPYDRWIDKSYDPHNVEQAQGAGMRTRNGQEFNKADREYIRALYDGSILYSDTHIGTLLDKLEELDLLKNTVIVFGSDHGEALAEDGRSISHGADKTFDEVTQVPLIMAGPGLPSGKRVDVITQNVDIVPTIIDLLDLQSDAITHGESLVPVISGSETSPPYRYAITRMAGPPAFSVRDDRFRYEYNLKTQEEHLYPVPDRIGSRVDVLAKHPEAAEMLKKVLAAEIIPRWRSFQSRPLMATFLNVDRLLPRGKGGKLVAKAPSGKSPATYGKSNRDNKWLLYAGQLFAASFSEDVPPLSFRTRVRNGTYNVLMEVYCDADFEGSPASSLTVKIGNEGRFKPVACDSVEEGGGQYQFLELGEYKIEDKIFSAVVDQGDSSSWAIFKRIILVPRSYRAEMEFARLLRGHTITQEDMAKDLEELKALGYLK